MKNRIVRPVNYDKLFDSTPGAKFVNEILYGAPDASEKLIDVLFSKTASNVGFAPACECQECKGRQFIGHTCPWCGTVVSAAFASNFNPINWIRIPPELGKVLIPSAYLILQDWASWLRPNNTKNKNSGKKQKVAIIDAILDPSEELPDTLKEIVPNQGYAYFVEHMDEIMEALFTKYNKTMRSTKTPSIRTYYETYRSSILTDKLPILHPTFHPMLVKGRMRHIDKTVDNIIPVISDLIDAKFSKAHAIVRSRYADTSLFKIYSRYIQYLRSITKLKFGDKYAAVRKHTIAGRLHWSLRGVITPIIDRAMADEIRLPWEMAVSSNKLEILNLLQNRASLTPRASLQKYNRALVLGDKDVYQILVALINESPWPGLMYTIGRNPSLIKGCIQVTFYIHVSTNLQCKSVGINPLIVSAPNADFDGDAMWLIAIKENGLAKALHAAIHPRETILSETSLGISSYVAPTAQAFLHTNAFLQDKANFVKTMFQVPSNWRDVSIHPSANVLIEHNQMNVVQ